MGTGEFLDFLRYNVIFSVHSYARIKKNVFRYSVCCES